MKDDITTYDLNEIDRAMDERGCPFDEPGCFNPDIPPECIECGMMNSENCNTCEVINPLC